MKKTCILFTLLFSCLISFGQVHLLGEKKEYIINAHRDCSLISVNDSLIKLECDIGEIVCRLQNGACYLVALTCDEDTKNYFIATYVEVGYKVEVIKRKAATFITFSNDKYLIQIAAPKDKEAKSLIVTSYFY